MSSQPKTPALKFTSYQVLVLALLALTQFTVVLDFMVMSPLGDMLVKSMDITQDQFGIVVASYAISAGVSGLLTAGFADRFDRKKLLLFFYVGFIVGTLFCGLATSLETLIAARIITGIFGGVIGSISMAIVVDKFDISQRGRVMAFMMMGFGASQVLGIPISLFIANQWGWQSPFFMIVGLSIIIWLVVVFKLKPVRDHLAVKSDKNAFRHLMKTLMNPNYRAGFLVTAFLSLGGFMMMPWGSAFAVNNLGVTEGQLPWLFFVGGVASLITMPLVGALSDRLPKMAIFITACFWMIIVVCIYTNMSQIPLWMTLVFGVLMMMGILSRMVPSQAITSALPDLHDRGAYMSINSSLQQMAGGVAAFVGGLIILQPTETSPIENYNVVGYIVSVINLISIFALYRVTRILIRRNKG